MHFSLQNKPKDVLKNPLIVISLLILVVIACAAVYVYEGIAAVYAVLLVVLFTLIAVFIKSLGKKGFTEFDVDDQGFTVNGNSYPWSDVKYYSWYGDKQSERVGLVGVTKILDYDPVNPYRFAKTQILELHMGVWRNLKLQVDSSQVQNLTSTLDQHGIKRISFLRKIVGY